MKPKTNAPTSDELYTPPYALQPILSAIRGQRVWESADGGLSALKRELVHQRIFVTATGLDTTGDDFFVTEPQGDVQVTNPPFSIKYLWLRRSYELNIPFALLMPVEVLGAAKAQVLFARHGVQVVYVSPRINFWTNAVYPSTHKRAGQIQGWHSSAQFPTAWFTWGLGLPENSFVKLDTAYWPDWVRNDVPELYQYKDKK